MIHFLLICLFVFRISSFVLLFMVLHPGSFFCFFCFFFHFAHFISKSSCDVRLTSFISWDTFFNWSYSYRIENVFIFLFFFILPFSSDLFIVPLKQNPFLSFLFSFFLSYLSCSSFLYSIFFSFFSFFIPPFYLSY